MQRRNVLKAIGLGVLAGAGAARAGVSEFSIGASAARGARPAFGARTRVLRIAHMSDFHIQPERKAAEGVAAALDHMAANPDRPDLVITGGDHVMDSFASDEARTRLQWDLFTSAFKDHCPTPVKHCLGNHDIWGWNKGKSKTTGSERAWGKVWAVETLGMPARYQSFDAGGWHIIILDSVQPDPNDPNGYIGQVDPEQLDWLTKDLEANKGKNTLVVSHVPIISATVLIGGRDAVRPKQEISGGLMHTDANRLTALFLKHPNVRAALSGHIHDIDRVEYQGVTYMCDGAVSGAWWRGRNRGTCDEGYALINLYDDGSVEREYAAYGWKAQE